MYEYKAKVINVLDGDTIDVEVDLGFNIKVKKRLRLLGIDTPEIFHPSCPEEKKLGLGAKSFVESLVVNNSGTIRTVKNETDKYGRYLADFIVDVTEFGKNVSISELLTANGYEKHESWKIKK